MVTRRRDVTRRTISNSFLPAAWQLVFVADLAVEEALRWGGGGDETLSASTPRCSRVVFDFCVALQFQNGESGT